jgi:hypothetical protein
MNRLDTLWKELLMDALRSDGAISDADVKDAVQRWRPKIEAEVWKQSAGIVDNAVRGLAAEYRANQK